MRLVDAFFAFPTLVLALAITRGAGSKPEQRDDRCRNCEYTGLRAAGAGTGSLSAGNAIMSSQQPSWE